MLSKDIGLLKRNNLPARTATWETCSFRCNCHKVCANHHMDQASIVTSISEGYVFMSQPVQKKLCTIQNSEAVSCLTMLPYESTYIAKPLCWVVFFWYWLQNMYKKNPSSVWMLSLFILSTFKLHCSCVWWRFIHWKKTLSAMKCLKQLFTFFCKWSFK